MKKYGSLSDSFYKFIKLNIENDPIALRLSAKRSECDFPVDFAIDQIACRKKNARKLPSFLKIEKFLFPDALAAEQSSNELVSSYHASLIGAGKRVLDMTAGLGIDSLCAGIAGNSVTAVELDENRTDTLRHNAEVIGVSDFEVICGDSIEYLGKADMPDDNHDHQGDGRNGAANYDVIFVDPARRGENNKREYFLHDCVPDVLKHKELIESRCDRLVIKASPILDIDKTLSDFPEISELQIVSVSGECKEVLLIIDNGNKIESPLISIVDLIRAKKDADGESGRFPLPSYEIKSELRILRESLGNRNTQIAKVEEIAVSGYIYDPNAGVHKVKCGDALTSKFDGLKRLSADTDLYFSLQLYPDFPGRCFRITEIPDKSSLKSKRGCRYEVIARNYPLNAAELMNKLKVKTGSQMYLIGASVGEKRKKMIIECERIY